MNELDKSLVHSICMSMVDLDMTSERFIDFVSQNKWLSEETIIEIKRHSDKAQVLINLAKKKNPPKT